MQVPVNSGFFFCLCQPPSLDRVQQNKRCFCDIRFQIPRPQEQNIALSWDEFQRIFNFLICIFLLVTLQKYWLKKLELAIPQSTPKIIHKGQLWFVPYSIFFAEVIFKVALRYQKDMHRKTNNVVTSSVNTVHSYQGQFGLCHVFLVLFFFLGGGGGVLRFLGKKMLRI